MHTYINIPRKAFERKMLLRQPWNFQKTIKIILLDRHFPDNDTFGLVSLSDLDRSYDKILVEKRNACASIRTIFDLIEKTKGTYLKM